MRDISVSIAAALTFAAVAVSPANAEITNDFFTNDRPVSDAVLGSTRGGSAPFASLSIGRLAVMVETNARGDLRFFGASGQYQMDIWWGTVGSELIAQSVRGSMSP